MKLNNWFGRTNINADVNTYCEDLVRFDQDEIKYQTIVYPENLVKLLRKCYDSDVDLLKVKQQGIEVLQLKGEDRNKISEVKKFALQLSYSKLIDVTSRYSMF